MIQWYPGHMQKATRQIQTILRQVDVVVELLDARCPSASHNPKIASWLGSKAHLFVLTKADLAQPQCTEGWLTLLRSSGTPALAVDVRAGGVARTLSEAVLRAGAAQRERERRKALQARPLRVVILGIPNVGKSVLVNQLGGRKGAKTGDRPGVTMTGQWIRNDRFWLYDTPGVLWPKLEDPQAAFALAACGAIPMEVLPIEEVAGWLIGRLYELHPDILKERYSLLGEEHEALEGIARATGLLQKGGVLDTQAAAVRLLRDFQEGRLGRITLELPDRSFFAR